jgi:hypothetical protein
VDHLGITGEIVQVAGDPVIEAHAQGNDQIGIHQGPVGFHGPVHAHHAQAHRVVHRQRRQSMQRKGHRDMGLLRKVCSFCPALLEMTPWPQRMMGRSLRLINRRPFQRAPDPPRVGR